MSVKSDGRDNPPNLASLPKALDLYLVSPDTIDLYGRLSCT